MRENGSKKDSGSVGVSMNDPLGFSESVVITAGVPFGKAGSTNLLRIAKIIEDKNELLFYDLTLIIGKDYITLPSYREAVLFQPPF